MKYKNKKTGAIIETSGKLFGGDWEKVKPTPSKTQAKKDEKK